MKLFRKNIFAIIGLLTGAAFMHAQAPAVIASQPVDNLFDSKTNTNWVSAFNGEIFPVNLEINFGSSETVSALFLQQPTGADLAGCKVVDFDVFFKNSATDTYPETPVFSGKMATDVSARQTFTFSEKAEGGFMLIKIKSVADKQSINAALSELGIRTQRKNGAAASVSYDPTQPGTWAGITWSDTQPYQVTAINWKDKTLMSGDFYLSYFPLLGDKYDFTNTQINVMTAVEKIRTDASVVVLPTLAENSLTVKSANAIRSVKAVSLLGVQIPLIENGGAVDVSHLAAGNYLVVVTTDAGRSITKIVKR